MGGGAPWRRAHCRMSPVKMSMSSAQGRSGGPMKRHFAAWLSQWSRGVSTTLKS